MPQIGLFIPCYVDQLYPQVGLATLRVLRRLGLDVEFPKSRPAAASPWPTLAARKTHGRLPKSFSRSLASTITW